MPPLRRPHAILALQRISGNGAVQRLLQADRPSQARPATNGTVARQGPPAATTTATAASTAAAPTVAPCTAVPVLLGSQGACASGKDFAFADHPSLGAGDALKVLPFRWKSAAELLMYFGAELGALAGAIGIDMIARFSSGAGGTVTHGPTSPLGLLAAASGSFTSALATVKAAIEAQLTVQAAAGAIDCSRITVLAGALPWISFGFSDGTTLKGAIGGTQGLRLFLTSITVDPVARTYSATLRFEICDDFGVDESDLYSPGLISFWVLQHLRTGYRPFVNQLVVEPTITGRF